MDELEINTPPTPEQPEGMQLLPEAQYYLQEAGKWAKFLGIMGFIGAGLMVFLSLFVGVIMSAVSRFPGSPAGKMGGFFAMIYLPIAVFYFFIALYTYQFGTRVKDGVTFGDTGQVTVGLGKLKSMFKLVGITTIVYHYCYVGIICFDVDRDDRSRGSIILHV